MKRVWLVGLLLISVSVVGGVTASSSTAGIDCFLVATKGTGEFGDSECAHNILEPNEWIDGLTPGALNGQGKGEQCVATVPANKGNMEDKFCLTSLAGGAYISVLFLVAKWLSDGKPIVEAEGPLATETETELELADLNTVLGVAKILCKHISVGTVGPEEEDETTEILNAAKESIGTTLSGLPLECTNVANCPSALVWPVHLPWLTQLELMTGEGEPEFLDHVIGNSGSAQPGWEIDCTELIGLIEDICEGPTASKVANTTENDVLETFNPEAPIESQKTNCSLGGSESGDVAGEGLRLLTNGKALSVG